jgi:hypothetical protein
MSESRRQLRVTGGTADRDRIVVQNDGEPHPRVLITSDGRVLTGNGQSSPTLEVPSGGVPGDLLTRTLSGTAWVAPESAGRVPPLLPSRTSDGSHFSGSAVVTNLLWLPRVGTNWTNMAFGTGRVVMIPAVGRGVSIKSLTLNVQTAGNAGSEVLVTAHAANADGGPGVLLWEESMLVDQTGNQTVALSTPRNVPDVYFLGVWSHTSITLGQLNLLAALPNDSYWQSLNSNWTASAGGNVNGSLYSTTGGAAWTNRADLSAIPIWVGSVDSGNVFSVGNSTSNGSMPILAATY